MLSLFLLDYLGMISPNIGYTVTAAGCDVMVNNLYYKGTAQQSKFGRNNGDTTKSLHGYHTHRL